ncbi:MAG: undecaprenyl-diphosphate phosphatase [Bacteroidales bacterium]|nr:undecaprenyl-diphosphate phosphatase [Candidatus Physcousia equi]
MDELQALWMGLFQGLTEYLPVSSSGHLAIAAEVLGVEDPDKIMSFTVAVHVATVLSTLVILWREVSWMLRGTFTTAWNDEKRYVLNILVSMIPIAVVGVLFKDTIEQAFSGLLVVGICLLITACLLGFSYIAKPRTREHITPVHAFVIGIAQAIAVLPGLSRSGSTIGMGLILGNKKEHLAQFSFLMSIPPILGMALLDLKDMLQMGVTQAMSGISPTSLIVGFVAAFLTGCFACKLMINLVKKGKMIWFALYCAVVGAAVLISQLF